MWVCRAKLIHAQYIVSNHHWQSWEKSYFWCRKDGKTTQNPWDTNLSISFIGLESHLHSFPRVLLSSALWRWGYWSANFLRAAWAQTMNAFMGRLMCGLRFSPPLEREGIWTRVQSYPLRTWETASWMSTPATIFPSPEVPGSMSLESMELGDGSLHGEPWLSSESVMLEIKFHFCQYTRVNDGVYNFCYNRTP